MRRWPVVVGALMVQVCLGAIYAWGTFVPMLKAGRPELAMMVKPGVLGIDPVVHAGWSARAKVLKKALAESTGAARVAAKGAWTKFLADEVTPALEVSEPSWGRYHSGFSGVQAKSVFSVGLAVFSMVMLVSGRWQDDYGPRRMALIGTALLGLSYVVASWWVASYWWVVWWVGGRRRGRHRLRVCLPDRGVPEMVSRSEGDDHRPRRGRVRRGGVPVHQPVGGLGRVARPTGESR